MASYSSITSSYPKSLSCRETQSETSSTDSEMSNLHTIAAQLGINMKELFIDQFKVEREKLETMLTDSCEQTGTSNAEKFFNDIMEETTTHIKWPRRLKIGAKTRKDPHVEIIGKYENVKKAKEQVISLLNSRGNRVTMKLNVSYRDHSFIIGKCGKSIKNIMDETKTHIHFPDSNRFNKHEKSNQVSFTGPVEGVEKARARVRKSSPLVLQFELPVMSNEQKLPEVDSPAIKDICVKFEVQVSYSHRSKLHATSVLVKGCESNHVNVKRATQVLISQFCKDVGTPIEVSIHMDISPQYHFIVKGKENRNLKKIMELTKTKVIFPDLNDTNFSPLRRCQISITGMIDGVCSARDLIIGNLPVALMFEYPEKNIDLDEITEMNKVLDVFITVRSKSHHGSLCIVVKGIEKYVNDIYEARNKILKLNQPTIQPEIPSTYYFQYENKNSMQVQSLFQMYSNSPHLEFPFENQLPYSPSDNLSQLMNRMFLTPNNSCSQPPAINISPVQDFVEPNKNHLPSSISPRCISNNTSGYHSVSSSTNSLDHLNNFAACLTPIPSASMCKTPQEQEFFRRQQRFHSIGSIPPPLAHRSPDANFMYHHQSPGFEMKRNFDHSPIFDFDIKKLGGLKAMEMHPRVDQPRTPTSCWAGVGLSRSSTMVPKNLNAMVHPGGVLAQNSPYTLGKTSGILDSSPAVHRNYLNRHENIQSLLTSLRLEHYIPNFIQNEIDLDMFSTLTEEDLQVLGITAFGPRKKLLMAINFLATHPIHQQQMMAGEMTQNYGHPYHQTQGRLQQQQQQQQQQQTQNGPAAHHGDPNPNEGMNGGFQSKKSPPGLGPPGQIPPKFSGSAAPGAERRTSNGS